MSSYAFLKSVTVLEVAQLGMDSLGGYLADMGAQVIKVEGLPTGDPIRFAGDFALGDPEGVGFLHLRWNRGKKSIGLDLRSQAGVNIFKQLASRADIVIEGLKGGAFDRMGIGYGVLRTLNAPLVYCSVSGLGRTGPYHHLRSHAVAYDAYAGLLPKEVDSVPPALGEFKPASIGMHAPGLYAALGVLSALFHAKASGEGAFLEVAAADAAANWVPDGVDAIVNAHYCQPRSDFLDESGRMRHWPRLWQYETRDNRVLLLEVLSWPTWVKFCKAVGREDLLEADQREPDSARYHAGLRSEIAAMIKERDLEDWMAMLSANDISAMPVNDLRELSTDEHYRARGTWYEQQLPGVGTVRLSGTPIKVAGMDFVPELAPMLGQHCEAILSGMLKMDAVSIERLRAEGVIS